MSHERGDSPYLVFGDFGFFLLQQLAEEPTLPSKVKGLRQSFQVVDEMITSADPELVNLIHMGVLEVLSSHPGALSLLKNNLSSRGQEKFEEWIKISHQSVI